jgi:protein-tyrosine phosphatase
VLPGIDDGPENIEESVVLLRAVAASGTRVIVATPHVSRRYPNKAPKIARLVDELNERLTREELSIEVRAGAEISLAQGLTTDDEELRSLSLGGGPWLLIEPPLAPGVRNVEVALEQLRARGHRILLAHPERCPAFQRDPGLLRALLAKGFLSSVTAGSLVGRFGGPARRLALRMLRDELVHNVASDTHDRHARPPGIASELEQVGAAQLGPWLTQEVPAAILAGEELPPHPRVALTELEPPRRKLWRRNPLARAR